MKNSLDVCFDAIIDKFLIDCSNQLCMVQPLDENLFVPTRLYPGIHQIEYRAECFAIIPPERSVSYLSLRTQKEYIYVLGGKNYEHAGRH